MEQTPSKFTRELAAEIPVVFEHEVLVEEVDLATVDRLARELDALRTSVVGDLPDSATALVVLDLSRVRFFGAAGLRCLLTTADQLAADGHRMIVSNPRPIVAKVLALAPGDLLS